MQVGGRLQGWPGRGPCRRRCWRRGERDRLVVGAFHLLDGLDDIKGTGEDGRNRASRRACSKGGHKFLGRGEAGCALRVLPGIRLEKALLEMLLQVLVA
jgi:hypothetical protein